MQAKETEAPAERRIEEMPREELLDIVGKVRSILEDSCMSGGDVVDELGFMFRQHGMMLRDENQER